ncbi:MAG: transcriptional modulator of MazE/toxin, MazF [Rhodoferax sp.]|nr:transcriptional modulator of MazE/toxin, MazF [Rhodoferax sp.]
MVWLAHDPQVGHEEAGHRPALVLSPKAYNAATGLMLCCPVTTQVKGYPFEVALTGSKSLKGVVLSDQLRSMDWEARRATKAGTADEEVVAEVMAKLRVLLPVR